jgi:hypothetical protein
MESLVLRLVGMVVLAILSVVAAHSTREKRLRLQRRAVAQAFSPDSISELQRYVREYLTGLRPSITGHPPENAFPLNRDRSIEYVKHVARVVGDRFGLSMAATAVRFSTDLKGQHAGRVQLRGGIYYIDIAKQYDGDPISLFAITAHEVAHVALGSRGIRMVDTQQNEELTDAATVLAGFGPLMLLACYSERRWVTPESAFASSVHRLGYLNPVAMAYLAIVHSELAGGSLINLPSVAAGWLREARRVRKIFLRQRAKPVVRREIGALDCLNCGTRLRLPDVLGRLRLRCPLCTTDNPVELRSNAPSGLARIGERLGWRGRVT